MRNKLLKTCMIFSFIFASPAFPDTLNIYGLGHLSLDSIDDGQSSSLYTASSSSRLGLKGESEIKPGLEVIYQFETGLDPTAQGANDGNGGANSDGQIFTKGRPSFVGLAGEFGTVLVGHMPGLDQWANDYNLFADKVGDIGNLWEGSGIPGRLDNVIYYASPEINSMDIAFTHAPEEGLSGTSKTIGKGNYKTKNLNIGLALASIGNGPVLDKHQAQAITIGYTWDKFSIGGGYQNETNVGGIASSDRNSLSIGGSVKLGDKGSIKAQYTLSSGDTSDDDASLFGLSYDYQLDKSTVLYGALASMDNNPNTNFSVNGKGHGDKVVPALGDDSSAISFGIIYSFDTKLIP